MRTSLSLLLMLSAGACAQAPVQAINAAEGTIAPDTNNAPSPTSRQATTPYQGYVAVMYPGEQLDAVSVDADGAGGVGIGGLLMASAPGGTFCLAGTMHGSSCVAPSYTNPATPIEQQDAGLLTVIDQDRPDELPASGDSAASWPLPPSGFAIGDRVTVTASGATVGGFSATATIPAPLDGVLAEFAASNPGTIDVSRLHNWTIRWTPAGASFVDITVVGDVDSVEWRIDDSAGELVIPAAVLAMLASEGASGTAYIYRANSAAMNAENLTGELDVTISYLFADLQF